MSDLNSAWAPCVLKGVKIGHRPGVFDLLLERGQVSKIEPSQKNKAEGLILPLLSDIHVHLDKTYIADRIDRSAQGLFDAIDLTEADKANWTQADIRARATHALEEAYANGINAMRSHVDCAKCSLPAALDILGELRQDWKGRIDLQLCALTSIDNFDEDNPAFVKAIRDRGCVLGGFVYRNDDLDAKLNRFFRIAAEHDLAVDFHVDEGLDADADGLWNIIEGVARYGLTDRVVVGHACSLSLRTPAELSQRLERMAELGIGLTVLPTTNLYLQDSRLGVTPRLRGIAPLTEAAAAGVDVTLGIDNCRDPFFPYGNYDPVNILRLATLVGQLEPDQWLHSVTSTPRRLMGCDEPEIAPGLPAEFILYQASGLPDLISRPDVRKQVYRAGVPVVAN